MQACWLHVLRRHRRICLQTDCTRSSVRFLAFSHLALAVDCRKRVFVLGPSHVVYLSGCALTTCARYATPFGNLHVDAAVNAELAATDAFEQMNVRNEEAEHSIEMQMPLLKRVMGDRAFTIVPILVGSLSTQRQAFYGKLLARYIADPQNLFIISTDFCHWGSRFNYSPHSTSSSKQIYEQISELDHRLRSSVHSSNYHLAAISGHECDHNSRAIQVHCLSQ